MKAVQYWALLKYLPLAVGCDVPGDNKHWQFLLHLSHLVDLVFSPRFTHGMALYMSDVIAEHLSMLVDLYSNEHIRLRPKHHFFGALCNNCVEIRITNWYVLYAI